MTRVWLLNLDAEEELRDPRRYGGDPARVTQAIRARPELALSLVGTLVPTGDLVIDVSSVATPRLTDAPMGFAWAPTAAARARLALAGATRIHGARPEVLSLVMDRGFGARVGLELDGALWLTHEDSLNTVLTTASPTGRLLLRRRFGFAGRARRTMKAGAPTEADLGFIKSALAEGGLLVEPWVERRGDFGLHAYISEAGKIIVGAPTTSRVTDGGTWLESERTSQGDLNASEREALDQALREAGAALGDAGYWGPFGIDAFRYVWGNRERFCRRCEINARYSMGWAIGMGDRRPDLE